MASPAIRELEFRDLDALLELYAHMHESDAPLPERARVEQIWRGLCDESRTLYLGAELDDRLVASCTVSIIPNLTRGARPYGLVENVVTHAEVRRRGLAHAVVAAALHRCWARDCYKVMLLSGSGRAAAHGLYEGLGFDPTAKQAFIAYPDDG